MPNPKKSAEVIESNGAAHKTKKEIAARKKAEQSALTGVPLRETEQTAANETAHKEFRRMKKLLKQVKKDDDIYRNVVNRYCMLCAECIEFVEKRETVYRQLEEFSEQKKDLLLEEKITCRDAFQTEVKMQGNILAFDKQIQAKRKMMLDIEKENGWTVKASIQTIPAKQGAEDGAMRELKEVLARNG